MNARHADKLTDFEIHPVLVKIAPEARKIEARKVSREGYGINRMHVAGLIVAALFIITAIYR